MIEVLSVFTLLIEVLMVLQCLQITFKQDVRFDKYMVGIILIDVVVYMLINLRIIPQICSILIYILFFIYCYLEFKQTIKKTIIRLIIGFSLAGCIEVIVFCITNLLKNENNSVVILFLSSVLALIIVCIIKKVIPLLLESRKTPKGDRGIFGLAIFYGLILVGLLIDYYLKRSIINIYAVFILTFLVFIFIYIYRLEQAQSEIDKKNYELELQGVYGGAYEKLLAEVRRRQHDYKNQIGTIYSMHLVAHSLEELVDMQKEYGDVLQLDSKFDSILTCCDNSVLAGYIYYRCISCENEGVTIDYNIHVEQAECDFALHEIIEILGILIDNACESFVTEQTTSKHIKLELQEDKEKIIFTVSNPAKYVSFSEIEKMFDYGYSSKGENRGIGLARVLELVNKYKAELKVFNFICDKENWIKFSVEISK